MKYPKPLFFALAISLLSASCTMTRTTTKGETVMVNTNPAATVVNELRHFPAARQGFKRMAIYLPEKTREQEGNYRVEIIPGKMANVDCNLHSLSGNLTKKELSGFGYDYYEFTSDGNMASTKMACPDNKMTSKFVSGETEMLSYNSRMPIVVYVPDGFQLKYRVWSASAMGTAM